MIKEGYSSPPDRDLGLEETQLQRGKVDLDTAWNDQRAGE
jgi:hypothetical protein